MGRLKIVKFATIPLITVMIIKKDVTIRLVWPLGPRGPSMSTLASVFMATKKTGISTLVTGSTRRLSLPRPEALVKTNLVVKVFRTVLSRTVVVTQDRTKVKTRESTNIRLWACSRPMTVIKQGPSSCFRKTDFIRNRAVFFIRQIMPRTLTLLAPVRSVIMVRMTTFNMLLRIVVLTTTRFLAESSCRSLVSIPVATLTSAVARVVFVNIVGTALILKTLTRFVAFVVKGIIIFIMVMIVVRGLICSSLPRLDLRLTLNRRTTIFSLVRMETILSLFRKI